MLLRLMKTYSTCILLKIILFVHFSHLENVVPQTPILLLSTTKDIRILNLTRNTIPNKPKQTVIIKNYSYIAALDYHYEKKKIFWADHGLESIQSITFNGFETEKDSKRMIVESVFTPDGLACDWLSDKIYWTDSDTNRIETATIEGKYRKVLFWTDIDQPRAIAVVPMKGLLFWTDWGESPKIERAGMNGDPKTRKILVAENDIFWPNGLTIDYKSELVYWIDGKLLFMKVMDYDGKNMSKVLSVGFQYPFALTQFDMRLFWSDWKTLSVHYFDRSTNRSSELFYTIQTSDQPVHPMDVQIWHSQRQPITDHPCQHNNGGCSHLCLLSPEAPGFTCECPMGVKLVDNHTCADGPQNLLLLARRTDICLIYLDSPDYSSKVLPLNDVKYSIAVDYDPIDKFIYWSDDEVKKIQRAKLDGSQQEDVITTEINDPDGITIDWISRNIYWTDAGTDRIEVARLEKRFRHVIVSKDLVDPRGIAVASELGWLFWSDWNEKNPKIERSNLDGSERVLIIRDSVREPLGWPNGITLDVANMKIYWCDAKHDKIEYANMDGSDRRELITDSVPHVFGFSLMGDFLYWTDWQRRAIDRAHKESGGSRELIVDQMENVMGLKAINLSPVSGWNPCKENNGNCSQLCFYRHNKTTVCVCEIDYELAKDKQSCVKPNAFLLYAKNDSIGRVSIENEVNEITLPIPGIKQASAIDFDITTMSIYWSDSKLRSIWRAYLNGSEPHRIVDLGLASPEGIAVDWLGLNIYWTDRTAHRIEVARLQGSSRRTLIWAEANEPHSIALDPKEGYMYWSEWSVPRCIKKAAMDGTSQMNLIPTNGPANGLTIDYEKRRLYWIEIETPAILTADLYGNDRRIVVKDNNFRPLGLTLYKDFIYWSDNSTATIWKADKLNGSNKSVYTRLSENVTDLLVYHPSKQNETNQCSIGNGGCKHLCLALPTKDEEGKTFTCSCPTHYTLHDNKCIEPSNFMIYSHRNLAVRLVLDTSDCPEAVLPIQGLKSVKAIGFDPKHNFLYWIDGKTLSIKRSEISGNPYNVVVPSNPDLHPFDLVIDTIGRLMFWTCASQNIINVTRLDNHISFGSLKKIEGEEPRLLAIHVKKRLLFYTDVGRVPQLVRIRLDGSHRIVITKGSNITAIAVDIQSDCIVWAQEHSIHLSNIDGENQHTLLNKSESPSQLAVHQGWLYFVQMHQLKRLDLMSGKSRATEPVTLPIQANHIVDLISVKNIEQHNCNQMPHQRTCAYFCILNGSEPLCACPYGKILSKDNKSCGTLPKCGENRFTCTVSQSPDTKDCIPLTWRCDGQNDCTDGSDEIDCPICKGNEFHCQDGSKCIDNSKVCDNIAQCTDRSDEKNCCKNGFQCPQTEVCLSISVICDGHEHCADGADEHHSLCMNKSTEKSTGTVILVAVGVMFVFALFASILYCKRKKLLHAEDVTDQSEDSLSPMHPIAQNKGNILRKGIPDVVKMSMLNDNCTMSTYDRRHVTGASSSSNTNGSSLGCYPREPLNPPPSPATTAASTRGSSPSSRYRPYRHYRSINVPPPPTPCSTDICDESDYNYPTNRSRYDGGPFPPPPTPRSHCQNESCPPSPSSRSSTYFSPLPPPPSPVASPRAGYDS